ncbi:DoxX family membrane protein [Actinomadura sp. WMMA1423]|uniref:DoxX family membrane protein n=1 Tax=Actinomadura sp. WMMA1423 TaxID=2591108 RepID=UPI0011462FD1|nr:DoxX family membrane protein [Actinomadura sp. WMMA1423]
MRLLARAHQMPVRLAVGAFVLNSGLSKLQDLEGAAEQTHGTAKTAYPFLESRDPKDFTRVLGRAEVALGTALVVPLVPSLLAGAALTAFSAGLAGLYLRLPGMRQEGGLRPSPQGIPLAKDTWLVGIGVSLVLEELARAKSEHCARG